MIFIEEAIVNAFISKLVSDCVDISSDRIKRADKNRENKNQNMQTRLYQIIIDVLNKITDNQYKYQDKIYDAAEIVLIEIKKHTYWFDIAKCGLEILEPYVTNNKCLNFKEILYREISREDNFDLYKEILLHKLDGMTESNCNEFRIIRIELNRVIKLLESKVIINEGKDISKNKAFCNNKKRDYVKKWNDRLFLHYGGSDKPLTLKDSFIKPNYRIYRSNRNINISEENTIEGIIENFMMYNRSSSMLIIGAPGIGKSTITSWIANKYNDNTNIIVLKFRDWEKYELKMGLLKCICNELNCSIEDLENTSILLDGFDEIKSLDIGEKIVKEFLMDLKDYKNFKCIITSREFYINSNLFENVLQIKGFDVDQIEEFCKIITGNITYNKENLIKNKEVLGIPVILYMALMSHVDLNKSTTKPELYNLIFAERGGIFDRFYNEGVEYDLGKQILRNPENVRKYLNSLNIIAFKMFEKNSLKLSKGEYQLPKLYFEQKKISVLEFPMKIFFEKTENTVEFIHKTIYEYFVSEYIYNVISKTKDKSKKEMAKVLGKTLKKNILSSEIISFFENKVIRSDLNAKYHFFNETFKLMLNNGMTYFTKECYKNVITCEKNVFINTMEILNVLEKNNCSTINLIQPYIKLNNLELRLLLNGKGNKDLKLNRVDLASENLESINLERTSLKGCNFQKANLKNANLGKALLIEANLKQADLRGANMVKANLEGADMAGVILNNTNLTEANLSKTTLIGINLRETNFDGANFMYTVFDASQVAYLNMRFNLKGSRVYSEQIKKIISYEEFCETYL